MQDGTSRFKLLLVCALLTIATLVTYSSILGNDFINYDDPDYVTANDVVKNGLRWEGIKWAFTTGHASNWHPMTWLSHMLDITLFGLKPWGHHLTNLLLHTINTILLFLLLRQMTGALWRSAVVAALFALHPLHVESVAWVAERKDLLSALFGILTLIAYVRYVDKAKGQSPNAKTWYGAALGLFACGLMSKPMLVTWPFVLLLLDVWPLERIERSACNVQRSTVKRLVTEKLPFLALVVASCVITVLVQAKGGAVTTAINLPLSDRLENAVASYLKYLGKTIWPTNLAIFYPHPETRYPISEQWPWWAIAGALACLIGFSALAFRQRRQQPYLATGWFWYVGTLVPVIGIVQVGTQALADRYTYIPLIGIFIAGVWGWHKLTTRFSAQLFISPTLAIMIVFACAFLSQKQITHWQNSFTIFQHTVAVTRHNAPAQSNLGTEYVKRGEVEEGIKHFKAALEADPHFADAAYSLGLVEQNRGNLASAADYYQDAIRRRPDHVNSQHNLGAVLWLQGQTREAELQFRETLRLNPNHLEANANLGNLLLGLRKPAESQPYLLTALQLKPGYPQALLGLALSYKMQGQLVQAAEQFRQIIAVEPGNLEAVLNLGVALVGLSQTNEAVPYFNQVTQTKPQLFEELLQTAKTLAAQGRMEAALDQVTAAACLKPDNVNAVELLAQFQAQTGRLGDAKRNFERVLALSPRAETYYYLGIVHALQGNAAGAATNLQQAIELKPDYLAALNELAWLFATHPDEKIRNGSRAVELAERTCKIAGDTVARYWGTLDAAYAEAGQFQEAIQTAEKTRKLALEKNQSEVAEAAAARLLLYTQSKPYRQK